MLGKTAVIIPWRDRGVDPNRVANLERVINHWIDLGVDPLVVDDGRTGDAQFNRSAAYNRGVQQSPKARTFVFAEADVLLPTWSFLRGVAHTRLHLGLVVPFTEYHYIGPGNSAAIRAGRAPERADASWIMNEASGRRSMGAVNMMSRQTYDALGGYDENFEGNWYDDDAMFLAFEKLGSTLWVDGPLFHLYHLPGTVGHHVTDADQAATAANKTRLARYQQASTLAEIRELITEGRS